MNENEDVGEDLMYEILSSWIYDSYTYFISHTYRHSEEEA
jgi:hypothetical protein